MAVSLARAEDRDCVPAWTGTTFDDDPWEAIVERAKTRSAAEMVAAAIELHLPAARVCEAAPLEQPRLERGRSRAGPVLDLSALWAGPYCGALLAEAGHEVIKIESPTRRDTTREHLPHLDLRLNNLKQNVEISLESPQLKAMIADARILITSARPFALARLGLDETRLFTLNPDLLWIAITGHGWHGSAGLRIGFGDDCAAAGGLVEWHHDTPCFMGDALADPLTGLTAATLALEALERGERGLLDVSLARTARSFAVLLQ